MAIFNSFDALKKQLSKDVKQATVTARDLVDRELFLNVNNYYTGSTKVYQRTGTLLTSPETTNVSGSDGHFTFDSYMDDGISYSTGTYSGAKVIDATEEGFGGTIGSHGYFRKTEEKVPEILDDIFSKL